jgi:hypothetical protein
LFFLNRKEEAICWNWQVTSTVVLEAAKNRYKGMMNSSLLLWREELVDPVIFLFLQRFLRLPWLKMLRAYISYHSISM